MYKHRVNKNPFSLQYRRPDLLMRLNMNTDWIYNDKWRYTMQGYIRVSSVCPCVEVTVNSIYLHWMRGVAGRRACHENLQQKWNESPHREGTTADSSGKVRGLIDTPSFSASCLWSKTAADNEQCSWTRLIKAAAPPDHRNCRGFTISHLCINTGSRTLKTTWPF